MIGQQRCLVCGQEVLSGHGAVLRYGAGGRVHVVECLEKSEAKVLADGTPVSEVKLEGWMIGPKTQEQLAAQFKTRQANLALAHGKRFQVGASQRLASDRGADLDPS